MENKWHYDHNENSRISWFLCGWKAHLYIFLPATVEMDLIDKIPDIKRVSTEKFTTMNSWWNCWIDICRNHKNILRKIHFQPVCFPFLLAHIIHTHTHHFWLIESTLCCILSEILTCHAVKQQTFTKHTMQIIIFCLSYWIASSALPLLN